MLKERMLDGIGGLFGNFVKRCTKGVRIGETTVKLQHSQGFKWFHKGEQRADK